MLGNTTSVQALRYKEFWTHIFDELGLAMDNAFTSSLKARDSKKMEKGSKQETKDGEITRRKGLLKKFAELHREQMDDTKTGKTWI